MRSNGYLLPILTLIVSALIITSCKESSYEIPTIDFKNFDNKIDLSLSDLISDIRVVPLETREDLLLSNSMPIAIGEKYIIASNKNELHQFDRDGRHIRVLAVQGKGPNEFNQITGFIIDNKNDILYYKDFQSGEVLKRVNLETGEHLPAFDFGEKEFYVETIDQNGNLYGFEASRYVFRFGDDEAEENGSYNIFSIYDPVKDTVKEITTLHPYTPSSASKGMLAIESDINIINLNYSDTLYKYNDGELTKRAIFKLENKMTDLSTGGEGVNLSYVMSDGIILSKTNTGFQQGQNSEGVITISIKSTISDRIYLNNKGEVSSINSILFESFGYKKRLQKDEIDAEPDETNITIGMPRYNYGYGFYLLDPIVYIQLLEYAIESKDVSEKLKNDYREQLNNIDEESNPILIIGKVK